MFKVIDNSIPFHFQESLKALVLNPDFPWSYAEFFSSDGIKNSPQRTKFVSNGIDFVRGYGFNHHLYFYQNEKEGVKSPFFDAFYPVVYSWMDHTDIVKVIRMNLRLTTKISNEIVTDEPHVDYSDKGIRTVVYYLFDTDGDTLFFNRKFQQGDPGREKIEIDVAHSITPKQGRAVFFDSDTYHSASHPSLTNNRITLNVQYLSSEFKGA
jgi:hypothetical protein